MVVLVAQISHDKTDYSSYVIRDFSLFLWRLAQVWPGERDTYIIYVCDENGGHDRCGV